MSSGERAFPVTPVILESEEVGRQFAGLLADADMKRELDLLKLGPFQIRRRRQAINEMRALYTAVWKLALNKSFPNDADRFYEEYLEALEHGKGRKGVEKERFVALVREYAALAEEHGEGDFTPLARRAVTALAPAAVGDRELEVRFILLLRDAYRVIFDKLI